jgi:hypothetical protein
MISENQALVMVMAGIAMAMVMGRAINMADTMAVRKRRMVMIIIRNSDSLFLIV